MLKMLFNIVTLPLRMLWFASKLLAFLFLIVVLALIIYVFFIIR